MAIKSIALILPKSWQFCNQTVWLQKVTMVTIFVLIDPIRG
jgi:hypothetical protein